MSSTPDPDVMSVPVSIVTGDMRRRGQLDALARAIKLNSDLDYAGALTMLQRHELEAASVRDVLSGEALDVQAISSDVATLQAADRVRRAADRTIDKRLLDDQGFDGPAEAPSVPPTYNKGSRVGPPLMMLDGAPTVGGNGGEVQPGGRRAPSWQASIAPEAYERVLSQGEHSARYLEASRIDPQSYMGGNGRAKFLADDRGAAEIGIDHVQTLRNVAAENAAHAKARELHAQTARLLDQVETRETPEGRRRALVDAGADTKRMLDAELADVRILDADRPR